MFMNCFIFSFGLDLLWKSSQHIPQIVVQNGDEPNGRIRKKHHQLNKSQQQSLNNVQGGPAPTRYKQGYS